MSLSDSDSDDENSLSSTHNTTESPPDRPTQPRATRNRLVRLHCRMGTVRLISTNNARSPDRTPCIIVRVAYWRVRFSRYFSWRIPRKSRI